MDTENPSEVQENNPVLKSAVRWSSKHFVTREQPLPVGIYAHRSRATALATNPLAR